jgi:hypothetical protein
VDQAEEQYSMALGIQGAAGETGKGGNIVLHGLQTKGVHSGRFRELRF